MNKSVLSEKALSKLDEMGVSYTQGNGTDISIDCEFLNSKWSTGSKKINYLALVYFDDKNECVFMWELTKEVGSGLSFGVDSESYTQTGTTLFRKVKSIKHGPDGKEYEYTLDLGEIPKVFKGIAKENGWKFKTVIKKSKALYPKDYNVDEEIKNSYNQESLQNSYNEIKNNISHQESFTNHQKVANDKAGGKKSILFWILFVMTVLFDLLMFIGGSGNTFLSVEAVILIIVFFERGKISNGIVKTIVTFILLLILTFVVFAITGIN